MSDRMQGSGYRSNDGTWNDAGVSRDSEVREAIEAARTRHFKIDKPWMDHAPTQAGVVARASGAANAVPESGAPQPCGCVIDPSHGHCAPSATPAETVFVPVGQERDYDLGRQDAVLMTKPTVTPLTAEEEAHD